MTTEEKWIQGEETVPSSAVRGATGLQEWHLQAPCAQLGRGKGLMPQRSNTSSGWGDIESLHLDVWMPYISSQDNCCTTGKGVRMRSARTHIQCAI